MNIYQRAERFGVRFETSCVGIGIKTWERLMKGAIRADSKKVHAIAKSLKLVPEGFNSDNNPYHQLKTKTHLIYIHSGIEHFIQVL